VRFEFSLPNGVIQIDGVVAEVLAGRGLEREGHGTVKSVGPVALFNMRKVSAPVQPRISRWPICLHAASVSASRRIVAPD